MSAGDVGMSGNKKGGVNGAADPWDDDDDDDEDDRPKRPKRRAERIDIAAKIARISREIEQEAKLPPPPAIITVGGVNEAKAYVPAIAPADHVEPEISDSRRVRISDPRQAPTLQLDRKTIEAAIRLAAGAEKELEASAERELEASAEKKPQEAHGGASARVLLIGIVIGVLVAAVPVAFLLLRPSSPLQPSSPEPGSSIRAMEVGSSAPPSLSAAPGPSAGAGSDAAGAVSEPVASSAAGMASVAAMASAAPASGVAPVPGAPSGMSVQPQGAPLSVPSTPLYPWAAPTARPKAIPRASGTPSSRKPVIPPPEIVN